MAGTRTCPPARTPSSAGTNTLACSDEARRAFLRGLRGRPYDRLDFNCWHLASLAQAILAGRMLPEADPLLIGDVRARARVLAAHPVRSEWVAIPSPVDCALVLMGRVAGAETHAGTWLAEDGGLILHTDAPHGVALDPPLEIAQARRWRITYLIPRTPCPDPSCLGSP